MTKVQRVARTVFHCHFKTLFLEFLCDFGFFPPGGRREVARWNFVVPLSDLLYVKWLAAELKAARVPPTKGFPLIFRSLLKRGKEGESSRNVQVSMFFFRFR